MLGRWLVHPSNSKTRSASFRNRHRSQLVGGCEGPADFVFMANAFHGVPDRARLAKAVGAALKPDGQFAIVNWHKRPREETLILGEPRGPNTELRMAPEETIKSVEAGSLKFIKLVEIPPYHYGVIFKRAAL